MKIRTLLFVLLVTFFTESCKDVAFRNAISYRLIKSDAKSIKSVITRKRLFNVAKCKDFAESKKALAFNFERIPADPWAENCILLRCPETGNITDLSNATGVDYYSSYTNNTSAVSLGNSTVFCIENVGLFAVIRDKQNFTNARDGCQKLNGFLADPMSDARTRGLAMIAGDMAYVGLSNEKKKSQWKNELGDVLACFDYRAWDTGEPSHTRGCVALSSVDSKTDPVWKVVSCKTQLLYICELPRNLNSSDAKINNKT